LVSEVSIALCADMNNQNNNSVPIDASGAAGSGSLAGGSGAAGAGALLASEAVVFKGSGMNIVFTQFADDEAHLNARANDWVLCHR
jgi:hypothetical protein